MAMQTDTMKKAHTKTERLAALDSARAVSLSAHAAAGLAAHVGAGHVVRALRVAEAMGRSAHALLVAHFAATQPPPRAPAGASGASAEVETGDKDKKEKKKLSKKKKKSKGMIVHAPASAPGAAALELDDAWADALPAALGPPCAPAASTSCVAPSVGGRVLVAHRSTSRSPPRRASLASVATSSTPTASSTTSTRASLAEAEAAVRLLLAAEGGMADRVAEFDSLVLGLKRFSG